MKALFFNAAGGILFERNDDESATVQHEELTLQVLYPYRDDKVIQRGMRIGYQDALGDWQVYEVRKAKTYEQDHYQEITAENICVSELTDEHFAGAEWTNTTASAALGEILTGTGWAVGTVTASNTSSANVNTGNVWQDVRTIENNWNVYILPRITVGSAGITGKYLDIVPSGGTWRGLRLSLDKNCDEVGVTWDDSNLKTALYAYGAMVEVTENGVKVKKPLTIESVVWQETAEHPAKAAGVAYLEDPAATAAFGRNGRPRFGYYQNGDISDANVLIEKTWESLKTLNAPEVTVDCLVTDLYRLGYVDVPLRLHDTALIEVRPTGVVLQKEIIQYTEDLNDPTQSRLVIGAYIPNIIYINRETNKAAGGGGGGGGQSNGEYKESLFVTQINANEYGLSVTSAELQEVSSTVVSQGAQLTIDRTGINSLAVGTGAQLNADGTLVVDSQGNPIFTTTGSGLYSKIEQNATAINLRVVKGNVATQLSVECGNVSVTGGNLVVDGYVTSAGLATEIASLGYVECATMVANTFGDGSGTVDVGSVTVESSVSCDSLYANEIDLGGDTFTSVLTNASVSGTTLTITKSDGTTVTFNKATTLGGGWSGGTFTVTAGTGEQYSTNITQGTTTWSTDGLTATIPIVATDTGSGGQSYSTGRSVYAYAPFQLADIRLQGSSLARKTTGYLYPYMSSDPVGYGSWFLTSNLNTTTLYYQGTRYTDTYYTKTS